jgi:hypothetical protein
MKKLYLLPLIYLIFLVPVLKGQTSDRATMTLSYPDSVITWKFDSQGDSTLNTKMNYLYDSHLHMIQSEKFTREQSLQLWVPNRKDNWEYDSQDRLTMWAIYDWDNGSSAYIGFMKETTAFDDHGNVAEYCYYIWNPTLSDWLNNVWDVFYYDDQDKMTRANYFGWNTDSELWDTTSYEIYDYDENGMLQHMTEWMPDEETGVIYQHEREDYQYDVYGNEIARVRLIYNYMTQLWYYMYKTEKSYDAFNRKIRTIYSEYRELTEEWIAKEKDEWGWDDSDSLILYAYYIIGEDLETWYPDLKSEMTYNNQGKMTRYRGYGGNDLGQWVPTYERRYGYLNDTLLMADSLFQWIIDDEYWNLVDCHNYQYDTLFRMHTDSYYKWVVHTSQYELSNRACYFYSKSAGIGEIKADEVEVFPNPNRGKLQITIRLRRTKFQINSKLQIPNVEIVDLYSKAVAFNNNRTIEQWNNGTIELDISRLPAGIYFVRIKFGNQLIVKKIIKI